MFNSFCTATTTDYGKEQGTENLFTSGVATRPETDNAVQRL